MVEQDPVAVRPVDRRNNKTADLERWLHGMRRLQRMMDEPAE